MFRLQDNVPQVYVNESRDFQLFCRLYDFVNNSVLFDVKTMINILDPYLINDKMLSLLAKKVGFFTPLNIDTKLLRYIISAFPYILKYKGSKKGIELAVSTILKVEGTDNDYIVLVDNEDYTINIYTSLRLFNRKALIEVLKYIMPIGYTFNIQEYDKYKATTQLSIYNYANTLVNPTVSTSQVIGSDRVLYSTEQSNKYNFETEMALKHIGAFDSTQVVGSSSDIYLTSGETDKDRLNTTRDTIDKSDAKDSSDNPLVKVRKYDN